MKRYPNPLLMALFLFLIPGLGSGKEYGLPRTGQLTVYHPPGEFDLGDDGAIRAGHPLTGYRFSATAYTVTDDATGLMWQKKDSGGEGYDLNTLIQPPTDWILRSAADINDNGQIVVVAELNDEEHPLLLTPAE